MQSARPFESSLKHLMADKMKQPMFHTFALRQSEFHNLMPARNMSDIFTKPLDMINESLA
jgi:hypothetical protein